MKFNTVTNQYILNTVEKYSPFILALSVDCGVAPCLLILFAVLI
jgi:hypothetical protein